MIVRLVTLRFGPETARTLSRMIVGVADADLLEQRGGRRGRVPGRRRVRRSRERSDRSERPIDGTDLRPSCSSGDPPGPGGGDRLHHAHTAVQRTPTSSPPASPTCCSSPTAAARAGRSWSTSSSRPGRTRSCPCAPRSTPPSPHRISSSATPCSAGPEPLPPSPWCSTTAPTGGPRRRGSRTSCRASTSTRWPGRRTSTPDEARAENVPGLLLGLLVPGQPAADLDRRLAAISRALEHDPQLRFEIAEELLSPLSSLFDHPMLKEKLKEAGVTTWLEVLTESRDRDRREARQEGRREGRREGRQEGHQGGAARGRPA